MRFSPQSSARLVLLLSLFKIYRSTMEISLIALFVISCVFFFQSERYRQLYLNLLSQNHRLKLENMELEYKTRKFLDHCDDQECVTCSRIICPYNDPLHFHHDGCPSCVFTSQAQ